MLRWAFCFLKEKCYKKLFSSITVFFFILYIFASAPEYIISNNWIVYFQLSPSKNELFRIHNYDKLDRKIKKIHFLLENRDLDKLTIPLVRVNDKNVQAVVTTSQAGSKLLLKFSDDLSDKIGDDLSINYNKAHTLKTCDIYEKTNKVTDSCVIFGVNNFTPFILRPYLGIDLLLLHVSEFISVKFNITHLTVFLLENQTIISLFIIVLLILVILVFLFQK